MAPRNELDIGNSVILKSEGITRGIIMARNQKGDVFVRWFDKEWGITLERAIDLLPSDTTVPVDTPDDNHRDEHG